MDELISYAKSFLGIPYKFGGSSPMEGIDCSGAVQEWLRSVGVDPSGDQSAMQLYRHFLGMGRACPAQRGALAFYGQDGDSITHVAMFINEEQVIEAAGGDSTTLTLQDAIKKEAAYVRIRPYDHRKDLIAVLMPSYPAWVMQLPLGGLLG